MGGRGANLSQMPKGMRPEVYEDYKSQGMTQKEILATWKITLETRERMRLKSLQPQEERYITTQTYERARKRMQQRVDDVMGFSRR